MGNFTDALDDLNAIRNRAGLPDYNSDLKEQIMDAILQERRVELFTEWGHRWLDLKRSPKLNEIMSSAAIIKGGSWEDTDQLYPILLDDIIKNPNLTQNDGY